MMRLSTIAMISFAALATATMAASASFAQSAGNGGAGSGAGAGGGGNGGGGAGPSADGGALDNLTHVRPRLPRKPRRVRLSRGDNNCSCYKKVVWRASGRVVMKQCFKPVLIGDAVVNRRCRG